MKRPIVCCLWILVVPVFLFGCGGDDNDTGTLSMGITDAKPLLEVDATRALITFDEVWVHKAGGGWLLLPMAESPYTIDLLQFTNGASKEFVPPVELDSGKYTQVRLGVTGASLETSGGEVPLEIPSENLKTNKNFDFDVGSGTAVDLMIDFDLSGSIVAKQDGYQLKPVLHLNETAKAATILGSIDEDAFGGSDAEVTVTSQGEPYTQLIVTDEDPGETEFRVFWLVPNREYRVTVEIDGEGLLDETVGAGDLGPGEVFLLNSGSPIVSSL